MRKDKTYIECVLKSKKNNTWHAYKWKCQPDVCVLCKCSGIGDTNIHTQY